MIFYLTLPFAKRHSSYLCSFCWLMLTHDFQTCLGGKRNHKIDIKAPSQRIRLIFWYSEHCFDEMNSRYWLVARERFECIAHELINSISGSCLLQTKFLSRIQMNVIRAHIHQSNYSICDWTSKAKNVLNLKTYFHFSMEWFFLGKYFLPQMMMATSKMNNDFNVYERCMLFRLNNFLIADAFYA